MDNCNCNQGPFEIFTGQDKTISLIALNPVTKLPLDLTSCTEINIALPNADGTFANLKLSASQVTITSPAVLGSITAPIANAVSALLNVGERQNIDVAYTISGLVTIVRYFQGLSVFESPV